MDENGLVSRCRHPRMDLWEARPSDSSQWIFVRPIVVTVYAFLSLYRVLTPQIPLCVACFVGIHRTRPSGGARPRTL
jgi:hypothetical protein